MFNRIWEQNKKFLLKAGAGLGVFLVLSGMLRAYGDRANATLREASEIDAKIRKLKQTLSERYWEEKTRLEAYETYEAELREAMSVPLPAEFARFDEKAPLLQLNRAIDRVWGETRRTANTVGVAIPEKLGPADFGVERGDGRTQYERFYRELAVVANALDALVAAHMSEIRRPRLLDPEAFPILGSEEEACLLYGAEIDVAGDFASFLRVFAALQEPKNFLQVRIRTLHPKRGDDALLEGTLEFAGVQLVSVADLGTGAESPSSSKGRRGKRR